MSIKFLLETMRLADGGRVECSVATPDGTVVQGIIEQSFFDEFVGAPQQVLTPVKRGRIVQDNIDYLEGEAERLWREGRREIHIK